MNINGVLLEEYLTTAEVCDMFGITLMTCYNWRKNLGLPHYILSGENRSPIRYKLDEVMEWAKEHDKEILEVPERLLVA